MTLRSYAPSESARPRAARRSCCCGGCLLALLLLLVPLYLALTPPKPPPPLPPAEAARIDLSLAEKKSALEKIARAAKAGRKVPFRIVFTEAEINRLLETDARLLAEMRRRGIDRAWVAITPGRIEATAILTGAPSSLSLVAVPRLDSEGRLQVDLGDVGVGRLGMPSVGRIRRVTQRAMALIKEKAAIKDVRLESISVGKGEVVVLGNAK